VTFERIGPYKVVRELGRGGMGAVYEAIQEPIGRRVAVKILHSKYAQDPAITARFFNEARAVNLIDHPGIVQVSDYGQMPDGTAYLVMEYLRGETLSQRQKQKGLLPLADVVRLARQIASALAAAHQKNVYHRDLKPDNVMLVPDPQSEIPGRERAKLLDFGIAKVAEPPIDSDSGTNEAGHSGARAPRTSTDVVMGTPRYMAPEQCKGGVQIDDKADVYSMGVMLYEMLAGRPPFMGASGEVLAMHIYEQPPPLRQVAPHVPEDLAQLVHRLMAKKKDERPNMQQVMQGLDELSMKHPTSVLQAIHLPPGLLPTAGATPPSSSPAMTPAAGSQPGTLGHATGQAAAVHPAKKKTALLVGLGAATLLVVAGGVVALRTLGTSPPPPVVKPVVTPETPPPPKPAPKPTVVHWKIKSEPAGASVVRVSDQQLLGKTPLETDVPIGEGEVEVKLSAPGFSERVLKLSRSADERREEKLDALPKPNKPPVGPRWQRGPQTAKNPQTRPANTHVEPRIVD
jgi:serine/threonine-protein kinase